MDHGTRLQDSTYPTTPKSRVCRPFHPPLSPQSNPAAFAHYSLSQPLDPDLNFSRASSFIRSAASQGAHLAVLPEYHLTNWIPRSHGFAEKAKQWQTYLSRYQTLAAECQLSVVPGTIVEAHVNEETGEEILVNVAYFISPSGKILGRYQKKNLWHPERPYLTSSSHEPHEVIDSPLGKVGLLICWDLAFPEAFRELIAQGAKIIIVPTFWGLNDCSEYGLKLNPTTEPLFLSSIITARAYENTCCVVFVNAGAEKGQPDPQGVYAGLSRSVNFQDILIPGYSFSGAHAEQDC